MKFTWDENKKQLNIRKQVLILAMPLMYLPTLLL